jgi:hypothetical protein
MVRSMWKPKRCCNENAFKDDSDQTRIYPEHAASGALKPRVLHIACTAKQLLATRTRVWFDLLSA